MREFIVKKKLIILYGISLAILLCVIKWVESHFLFMHHSFEMYSGCLAVIFTFLGVWLTYQLRQPKTVVIEKEIFKTMPATAEPDTTEIEKAGLSKRELDVLQLMAEGLSNQEIADRLFVSLNTIKTHSSKLFEKMDVKRRTQAVEKAKRLKII